MIGNLLIRQTYNELLKASEKYENNKLPHRIQYFLDEFGTYTAIEGVEQFFSAGRSRKYYCKPFLQSLSQLDEKYGVQTAKNIRSSCQNTIFTYLSPLSDDAKLSVTRWVLKQFEAARYLIAQVLLLILHLQHTK